MRVTAQNANKKKKGVKQPKRQQSKKRENFGLPANKGFNAESPLSSNPTHAAIVAHISPFRVPRGVAGILSNARPSQKFTARAIGSFSILANAVGVMYVSPCIASDFSYVSAVLFTGTSAALATQLLGDVVPRSGISALSYSTNTPYSNTTLNGGDFSWRLVSAGVRIRNVSAPLNRQGILKYIADYNETLIDYADATFSQGQVATAIDSNHRVVRRNMALDPDTEIAMSGNMYRVRDSWCRDPMPGIGTGVWPAGADSGINYQISGVNYCPIGTIITFPSVAVTQAYDLEIVEHWECVGTTIETLHTPSPSHAMAADLVNGIVTQAHHQHALQPDTPMHLIAKGITFAEHHKAALKDAGVVASAIALL